MAITFDAAIQRGFEPVLERLREEHHFGAGPAKFEILNHYARPYSEVIHVQVQTHANTQRVFIKIYKPSASEPNSTQTLQERVAADYAETARVYQGMSAHAGLKVVRPVACFPEHFAIVTEEAIGETLDALLKKRAAWHSSNRADELSNIFARIGAWLKAFQSVGTVRRPLSLTEMREYWDERLRKIVASPRIQFDEENRRALFSYFDTRTAEIPAAELIEVNIHADFCLENILVDGDKITVLDFTTGTTGSTLHDLSHLFMHLELLKSKPWMRTSLVNQLQKTLLSSFEPRLTQSEPLFELLVMQQVICRLCDLTSASMTPLKRIYNHLLWRRYDRWIREPDMKTRA